MQNLAIVALDGVMDSSLAITLDTLRTANAFASRQKIAWSIVGHRKAITTGGGMRVQTDHTFRDAPKADWMIVPGLGLTNEQAIEARLKQKDAREAMEALRSERVAASCSAVFLLAEAGLLDGRTATTTWWLGQTFRERYPKVQLDESRMLVSDGRFLTAGSAFAQLDLILAVITATLGPKVAHLCSRYMLIDRRASQARYMIPSHVRHVDETVLAAERWIDANLAAPMNVSAIADAVAVSPKTLARRIIAATGLSPVRFLQRRRVMEAVHLLETTALNIDDVAERVGYQDATALRKIIKRELGIAPSALRAVHG